MADIPVFCNCPLKIPSDFAPPARALGAAPAPLVLLRCSRHCYAMCGTSSGSHLRRLPSQASKPFGAFATLRRRRSSTPARETGASGGLRIGRACFPSPPRQPCGLPRASRALAVSLRCSVNRLTAFHFAASQACGILGSMPRLRLVLLRGPRNPSVSSATPGACALRLRLRACLPSHASEPPAVSPRGPRSPAASLGLRLARRRSPREFCFVGAV